MTITPRSFRLVSALAVAAVSIAALSTVAASWIEHSAAALPAPTVAQAVRPAADQPVHVVKAPRDQSACRDCGSAPLEKWL